MTIERRANQFQVDNLSYFTIDVTPPKSSNDVKSSRFRRWLKLERTETVNEPSICTPPATPSDTNMRSERNMSRSEVEIQRPSSVCNEMSMTNSKRRKLKNWFRTRTRSRDSGSESPPVAQSQNFMTFRRTATPTQSELDDTVSVSTERPNSVSSRVTDLGLHSEPITLPRRVRGEGARRSNSIASISRPTKPMPQLKQQMSDPGARWKPSLPPSNVREAPRYLEEETSNSTTTSSTICGSELTRSSDTLTSSRSRTRPRNHTYDCCCLRCTNKAQNKVADDVVIIYAGQCPYSPAWARYIHKELTKEMSTETMFKIHFRQLEEIIQDTSASQDLSDVRTQRRNSVRSARLQVVILSSAFLDITYSHANDEWARLLSPKRIACLLLGVNEARDVSGLHRAALISYESWYRISVGHEDSGSFKKFIGTAQKIYMANDSHRGRIAVIPDHRTASAESTGIVVFPETIGVVAHDALILLEKPLELNDQCSVSFSWSDCTYKVGPSDIRRLSSTTLRTTVPGVYSAVDTTVDVSLSVNDVVVGARKLKYVCPFTDLKNILRNTPEPLELVSKVIQSEFSSRDDLVQIISRMAELSPGDGMHMLPHPNGAFAVNNSTGLISPVQDNDDDERIGYQIPRPLDMTYLVPPPPKPIPLPKIPVRSEKVALINHDESFDSAYYNLQSPDDSLNEVSASSSCITTIYMPQPRLEASYLNLPPSFYNMIQIRQKEALEICGPLAMDTADESFIASENKSLMSHRSLSTVYEDDPPPPPPPPPPPQPVPMRHSYVNIPRQEDKDAMYENVIVRMSRSSDTSRESAGVDSFSYDSDNEKSSVSSDGIIAVEDLMALVRKHQAKTARVLSIPSSHRSDSSTPSLSLALSDQDQQATSSGSCSPCQSVTPDSGMSEIQVAPKDEYYVTPRYTYRSSKELGSRSNPPPPVPCRPPHTLREEPRYRLSTFGK